MSNDKQIKRMSELLRSGATMTGEHCPECNTPLFIVKGQLICPKCDKLVVVVKEGEEEQTAISLSVLVSLENTLLFKLQESDRELREAKDMNKEKELGALLNIWLEAIERLKRVQKNFAPATQG